MRPESQRGWQRITGKHTSYGRLFLVPEFVPHAAIDKEVDPIVLSGVAGLHFRHRTAVRRILSKEGYSEFGFRDRLDAASFVGAYELSSLNTKLHNRLWRNEDGPTSFRIKDDGSCHDISVGGDFHGDFRITKATKATIGAVAPTGELVDFAPEKVVHLGGLSLHRAFNNREHA